MDHLKKMGIGTGIHYPIPLHRQKAYTSLSYQPGDFPTSENAAAEILSLPMYPQLTAEQQAQVVREILQFAQIVATSNRPADKPVTSERAA
jgi:dTDP-4-amino-4,6-dideoxygalactose transaminase